MAYAPLRLSVVLATYNGAKYMPAQLQSLLDQSRRPDELIVSDDGSSDDTVAVCEAFAARSPFPVVVHRQPANVGVHRNFNTALSLATGDVLFCCDQDDVWHAGKLARFADVFEADAAVGMVMGDANLVDTTLRPLGRTLWDQLDFDKTKQDRVEGGAAFEVYALHVAIFGCTIAVRGTLRDAFLPIPPGMPFDTWTGRIAAACAPCRLIREPLQDYRQHPSQSTGVNRQPRWRRTLKVLTASDTAAAQADVELFQAYARRLATLPATPHTVTAVSLIDARLRLTRARLTARRSLLRRVPLVARCVLDGSYRRFAHGLRSACVDLLAVPEKLF